MINAHNIRSGASNRLSRRILTTLFVLATSPSIRAQTNWTPGTDTWDNPTNWSMGIPIDGQDFVISNGGTAQITTGITGVAKLGTLGSTIGSSGNLSVTGTGSLTLSDELRVGANGTGNLTIAGGTVSNTSADIGRNAGSTGSVTVSSGVWINSETLSVGDYGNGTMEISGTGSVSNNLHGYIGAAEGSTGLVKVSGGNWTNGGHFIVGGGGNGTLEISGTGSVSSVMGTIGQDEGSTGLVKVSGGSWTTAFSIRVGHYGNGTLEISDTGSVSSRSGSIGSLWTSTGLVKVSGGSWIMSSSLDIGSFSGSEGLLEISGYGLVSASVVRMGDFGGTGNLDILGGTLSTGQLIENEVGGGIVTFNGGTLQLSGNQSDIFLGFESGDVTLTEAGGKIDSQSFNVATNYGLGGDGSLNKTGSGTLTLSGTNTYTGGTSVEEGKLIVDGQIGDVTVLTGGTLGGVGSVGIISLDGGTLAPGNSPGTLAATDLNWDDGTMLFELGPDAANSDFLSLSGTLSGNAGTYLFNFQDNGWQEGLVYDLITFNNTSISSGDFDFSNGSGFDGLFGYDGDTLQFTIITVPEPGTITLTAVAIAGFAFRRSRKNET